MNGEYTADWPLPNEFLIEIGRLSSLWGTLEYALNISIGKLAGFNDLFDTTPFILTVHSSFPQRLDILGALCEQKLPQFPHLKNYKEVISKIRSAQALRNRFVHNGIGKNPDTGKFEIYVGSARQSLKTSISEITSTEIHNACKDVHEASLALHELITKVKHQPVWE